MNGLRGIFFLFHTLFYIYAVEMGEGVSVNDVSLTKLASLLPKPFEVFHSRRSA